LPLCGAALTFFAAAKKVSKESGLTPQILVFAYGPSTSPCRPAQGQCVRREALTRSRQNIKHPQKKKVLKSDVQPKENTMSASPYESINFADKLSRIHEHWQPRVVAEMNDYQFKIVKIQGDFIWHDHADTDETFIVLEGELRIDFRDGAVRVCAGEMVVVPKGKEHKPYAENEVKLLLIEPRGVKNTGSETSERTAANDVWI
jgi:mannose-6-phosphate isomerase-like protein (cupin superfamily)